MVHKMKITQLPDNLTVQYSELLQNCVHPISDGSNISFKYKAINGKKYWYLYISLGTSRREHYLGEESTEILDQIDRERAAWESIKDDKAQRTRLVDMLISGGMAPTSVNEGKILTLLERSGVFLAGAALVGTVAFRAYGNMLGVTWESEIGTQDIDIAADNRLTVALPRQKKPINLTQLILDSGMGFLPVPALDKRNPSTSFKIRRQQFLIDVLTPMRGRESSNPIKLADFNTYAEPLRHLDYVLEEIQPAVLLYGHGIMINVPSPARFAIHKCVISQKRPVAQAAKSRKDLSQAAQVFEAMLDIRPAEVSRAWEAAKARGKDFIADFDAGFDLIDEEVKDAVRRQIGA